MTSGIFVRASSSSGRVIVGALAAACLWAGDASASAADYESVGNDPAILYDAPTLRGTRVAIAPRGMPVEVIVAENDWVRVRDSTGGFAWIEKKSLVAKRTVVVLGTLPVDVRQGPDEASPVVFRVQPGVVMDLVAPPSAGWVGVRHRDGSSGFVRVASVWGG
jgi:hypothetical protein